MVVFHIPSTTGPLNCDYVTVVPSISLSRRHTERRLPVPVDRSFADDVVSKTP